MLTFLNVRFCNTRFDKQLILVFILFYIWKNKITSKPLDNKVCKIVVWTLQSSNGMPQPPTTKPRQTRLRADPVRMLFYSFKLLFISLVSRTENSINFKTFWEPLRKTVIFIKITNNKII